MATNTETFTTLTTLLTTRADFQRACISLLKPLVPCFSPQHAKIRIGATGTRFDEPAAQLEGYARPLWGLAALLAGGGTFEDTHLWVDGLKNGTDPQHPEFWGYCRHVDQRMVEMCPIGFALAAAGDTFWGQLDEREQSNVGMWLRAVNDREMPNTNWLWFRVFANLALLKNGAEYDQTRLDNDLDHLDTFYRGDGWSNDGPKGYTQMDSYSGSYAIQFLQLLYAKLNGDRDPARAAKFKDRARVYALDAVLYYDERGRHITFGRSLTYRFAMAGFWAAVAYADVDLPAPLTWGVVKGLLLRNCRWWMAQPDILTPTGLLTIGYTYPNQFLSENYNSPGSPYWFMLSFAALACPDAHPFWTSSEEPFPTTSLPMIQPLKHPLHILVHAAHHTFLLSSGQECHYPMRAAASKYAKYAYSSAFGYSVPTGNYTLESLGSDNALALSDDYDHDPRSFDESWRVRRRATNPRIDILNLTPVLVSDWRPWPDVTVSTWLIPPAEGTPCWHMRIHRIRSGRALRTAESAWALYGCRPDGRELDTLEGDTAGRQHGSNEAIAVSEGVVGIAELGGATRREGRVLDGDANANLVHMRSVLPTLMGDVQAGGEVWYVSGVFAMTDAAEGWRGEWRRGWEARPVVPAWVRRLVENGT